MFNMARNNKRMEKFYVSWKILKTENKLSNIFSEKFAKIDNRKSVYCIDNGYIFCRVHLKFLPKLPCCSHSAVHVKV